MRVFALFGRPAFLRRFHGVATLVWLVLSVPSMLWWRNSLSYLVGLSVYAVVTGHWSSWQAARVEVRQEEQIEGGDMATKGTKGGLKTIKGKPKPTMTGKPGKGTIGGKSTKG